MNKTLIVAWREFTSTVLTKGFLIGVGLFPLIMAVSLLIIPGLISTKAPKVTGTVAVIDQSGVGESAGEVAPLIAERLSPEKMAEQSQTELEQMRKAMEQVPQAAKDAVAGADPMIEVAAKALMGEAPEIRVETLPASTDIEQQKDALRAGAETKGSDGTAAGDLLALIVIKPDSVRRSDDTKPWGGYEVYVKPKLDERWQNRFSRTAQKAVVDARLKASGEDATKIRALMEVPEADPVVVTAKGEREGGRGAQFLLPMGFMMLLWASAFTGGQYLLTTTIEEKSNRIMEVLLSAVSPLQLMVGKILGQMGVGLLILGIYAGLGITGLSSYNMLDLIDWSNIVYLVIYFLIAFFLIASIMAAVGSAVSDIHEAQSLVGPIMMILIIPMLLIMPISTNPNSTLAMTLSFIPPMSPFIMVMRIAASTEPLPFWQIALSIAIGLAAVCIAAWAAAKIFRIGVLLYGKPPNFATLLKWVRMA